MMKHALISLLALGLSLGGCATQQYKDNDAGIDDVKREIEMHRDQTVEPEVSEPLSIKEEAFVEPKEVPLEQVPEFLQHKVDIQAENLPLDFLVYQVMEGTNIPVTYDATVSRGKEVSLFFKGTAKEALDMLAAASGYHYRVGKNKVSWSALVTRSFNIGYLPGENSYNMGVTEDADDNSATDAAGNDVAQFNTDSGSSGEEYSQNKGELNVWDDLNNVIDSMLSEQGRVFVSEATTTVTVTDSADRVEQIANFIESLNGSLSSRVRLDIKVIEVNLNDQHRNGVDLNLVREVLGGDGSISLANEVRSAIANRTAADTATLSISEGDWAGTNVLLDALSEQGKVSVVTEPSTVVLNNNVASIQITNETAFLKSIKSTVTPDVGATTELTPGVVKDGFTLFVLPTISDEHVLMHMSSNLSTLKGINEVSSGDSTIQTPQTAQNRFNLRTAVRNGETLVLGGFRQTRKENTDRRGFGTSLYGGIATESQEIETLVLVTPTVIRD